MRHTPAPVFAVIPHYNDSETLSPLIGQLSYENYAGIYIIDDASPARDCVEAAVEPYGKDADLIIGGENVGSGPNRNRILSVDKLHTYGNAILHFIDADVSLASKDTPDKVRAVLADTSIGLAGGLLIDPEGHQNIFNYGPAFTVAAHVAGLLQLRFDSLVRAGDIDKAQALRQRFKRLLEPTPDTSRLPKATDAYWVVESNLAIAVANLKAAGGFPNVRYHEIQGLAHELERAKLRRRFDPSFAVSHPTGEQSPVRRPLDQISASLKLMGKYGMGRFIAGPYTSSINT